MRQKIGWLTLLTTLAFWAGCATDDQNYKINQEQTPLFEENYPTQPNRGASVEPTAPDSQSAPSLDGLERDHWKRVAVTPASGRVPHHPHYFDDEGVFGEPTWRFSEDRPAPLLADADITQQATRVTQDARAPFDRKQLGDAFLGPPKFATDLVILPYQVWRTPPWRVVYTPETP